LLLVLLCYILGLVTASYVPIPAHLGALLTTLLQGKIRDLNIDANVVTFDWTSNESVLGYAQDVLQLPESTKHLVELLKTINNEVKPQKIAIIAHSLGCRLVCLALQQLRADPEAANLKLDQVVFLAPNVDREEFDRNFKSELEALVNRLTI